MESSITNPHALFFKPLINLFAFGCAGSLLLLGLFSDCGKWGYCLVVVCVVLVAEHGSRGNGLHSYGAWTQQLQLPGFRAQAQQLFCKGLVAPWHVGSSSDHESSSVFCIDRQILYHIEPPE